MELFFQTAGWIGTILCLVAYFLVSREYVTSKSRSYALMNLFGALGIGLNVFHHQAWPAVTLEVIWGAIAIFSLLIK